MEEIFKMLEMRQNQLLKVKKEKEKALMNAPEGNLRVCCHGNRVQYYLRNDPKDFSGVYIKNKDLSVAQKLAQKDYDRKVLGTVERELNVIHKFLAEYPQLCAERVFESLHRERKKLIKPIQEPEDELVKKWQAVEYQGKGFKDNIPYRYEYPIYLEGIGMVYPDFTTLNVKLRKEIYWEHMGMMDDPEYVEKALQKIAAYEQKCEAYDSTVFKMNGSS